MRAIDIGRYVSHVYAGYPLRFADSLVDSAGDVFDMHYQAFAHTRIFRSAMPDY
jgi:hypothetical protein